MSENPPIFEEFNQQRDVTDLPELFTSAEQLRRYYGTPADIGLRAHIDHITPAYRRFIERAPFVVLGTVGADGVPSTSPKGDAPGFVKVLDASTLAIPDWPGNNQIDSLTNIVETGRISLIFLIPGVRETMRMKGRARIVTDPALRQTMTQRGKLPLSVIKVRAELVYVHCGKALVRSKLWEPGQAPAKGEVPTISAMLFEMEQNRDLPGTVEAWDAQTDDIYQASLY